MQQYAGLLNDPKMAALLGAAGGLLGASGPTPYKVGLGGMMGQGLGGAMSGMLGAEQYRGDQQMRDLMRRFMEQQLGGGMEPPMPATSLRQPGQPAPQQPMAQPIAAAAQPQMPGMGMMPQPRPQMQMAQPQATGHPRPLTLAGFGGF